MARTVKPVFSDYEVREMGIKFTGSEEYLAADCIGSSEEAMNSKVITKKCRGTVAKTRTKGTGDGTLKLSLHLPYEIYINAYGMELDTLIEGVKAYGQNSVHKEFSAVQRVFDEDGIEKLKAYPRCIIQSGKATKTENGAEEVAELELEIAVMPDEYGNGVYEVLVADLTDETVKTTWMTAFTPELVQKKA